MLESSVEQPLDKAPPDEGCTPVRMWDIPPIELTVTHFDPVRRHCPVGHCTQPQPPAGSGQRFDPSAVPRDQPVGLGRSHAARGVAVHRPRIA